jgi:excisionase family DNA binding protein
MEVEEVRSSPWLVIAEAAAYARVSQKTLYRAAGSKSNPLRAARVGGRRSLRFKIEWLDAWLERSAPEVRAQ